MNQFEDKAAVAPRTVTEISEGKHAPAGKPRRKAKKKVSSVVRVLPRKDVWKEAQRLAAGHPKRLLVVSEEVVIVCNSPAHREAMRQKKVYQ